MNLSLFIFFVFIFILIALIILGTMTYTTQYLASRETIIIPATNVCSVDETTLPRIDLSQDVCCYNNGVRTGAYYVQTEGVNSVPGGPPIPLEFSAIAVQTYYITVCREYCFSGYILTADGSIQCNGESSVTAPQSLQANACVSITEPLFPDGTPCRGSSLPIALAGNDLIYGFHVRTTPNSSIPLCSVLGPCD